MFDEFDIVIVRVALGFVGPLGRLLGFRKASLARWVVSARIGGPGPLDAVVQAFVAHDVGGSAGGTGVTPACAVVAGRCPCGMPDPSSSVLDDVVMLMQIAPNFHGSSK